MRVPPAERPWGWPLSLLASDLWPDLNQMTQAEVSLSCLQGITKQAQSPLPKLRQFLGVA